MLAQLAQLVQQAPKALQVFKALQVTTERLVLWAQPARKAQREFKA
jgi:hypothetical protein